MDSMTPQLDPTGSAAALVAEHRRRILIAFRAWVGDLAIAEDLTQETLFEAWRSQRRPDSEPDLSNWLYGVARNVYRRHRQNQARHGHHLIDVPDDDAVFALAGETGDLDLLIEHEEIVSLLDAALARIPPESRRALLLRYIEDLPQREIATQLGIGEKALEGKLHRGKRALHRYLITDGCEQSRSLGLLHDEHEWRVTNIWCDACGNHRLLGRWYPGGGFQLDCPACDMLNGERSCNTSDFGASSQGLRSFGAALSRVSNAVHEWASPGVAREHACPYCGSPVIVRFHESPIANLLEYQLDCPNCPGLFHSNPIGAASSHPAFRTWAKNQRRVTLDPTIRTVERDGRETTHLRWTSRTSSSTWEALRDRQTMREVAIALDDRIVSGAMGE